MPDFGIKALKGPRGLLQRLTAQATNAKLREFADQTVEIVEAEIKARTPVEDGHLQGSIRAVVDDSNPGRIVIQATGLPYGVYPDQGTGIYGKHATPIRAKSQRGMRFYWKKRGRWVRARTVAGQPAQDFMRKGRDAGVRIARRRFGKLIEKS